MLRWSVAATAERDKRQADTLQKGKQFAVRRIECAKWDPVGMNIDAACKIQLIQFKQISIRVFVAGLYEAPKSNTILASSYSIVITVPPMVRRPAQNYA
jgi:hypothetical protein